MNKLEEELKKIKSVAISGHVRPDGDCVGSTLAIYNYIRCYYPNIEAKIYLEPIPNVFSFLQYSEEIIYEYSGSEEVDLFFVLDCGDVERLGKAKKIFQNAKKTICIDHHISNECFADVNYVYPNASSTCELVFELLEEDKITTEIAECLYTGIVHDTGVFQYDCTSEKTMNIAGRLMCKGISFSKIVDETFYTKTYNQNRIMGQALMDAQLYLEGKCIISYVTQQTMKQYAVLPKHLDGIVNQLRVTKDIILAVFMYENEDASYKVSLRVNGDLNVAEIAASFGGGGHVKAAGYTAFGSPEQIINSLLNKVAAII